MASWGADDSRTESDALAIKELIFSNESDTKEDVATGETAYGSPEKEAVQTKHEAEANHARRSSHASQSNTSSASTSMQCSEPSTYR